MSDRPVDVGAAADPVAAFLEAHRRGGPVALRTSGSSGTPRAVVRTTASWVDSFDTVAALTSLAPASRVWLPGPVASTMNLFAAVLSRWVGAAVVPDPGTATHAHLTPSLLTGSLDRVAGLHVTVAGARLPAALHARAVAAGAELAHYYGAAELSFVAWGPHADALTPFPGVEVEVRDEVLWARSPFLCEGYDGVAGPMQRDARGFATVGDRGVVDGGLLTVAGRGDDAVTTGAATVLVADVEAVLAEVVTGEVVVVGLPHAGLGEVLAAVLTDPEDRAPARRAAATRLDPAQRPRMWFHLPRLPLGAAGKVDRAALRQRLAQPGTRRLTGTATP